VPVVRNIKGLKQPNGKLRAIERVGKSDTREGYFWWCVCDCGRTRTVLTSRFLDERIRSCRDCAVEELRRDQIQREERDRKEWERFEDEANGLRDEFYDADFRSTWKNKLQEFNDKQALLFEIITDGRKHICMQATDLVLRTGTAVDQEIESFGLKRRIEAQLRLRGKNGTSVYRWVLDRKKI
jgi:hypothetical protein